MLALTSAIKTKLEQLTQKNLIIFGLGREGLASYQFLRQWGVLGKINLVDNHPASDLSQGWELAKDDPEVSFFKPEEVLEKIDSNTTLLVTPGIPPHHPLLQLARERGAQLTSGTQLFFDIIAETNKLQPQTFVTIAVTGTKGKSTTSSAIYHLLHSAGYQTYLGGNIGRPLLTMLNPDEMGLQQTNAPDKPIYLVSELSSHQLAQSQIKPNVAVLLNITPEHLDYYNNFGKYLQAKAKIVANQDDRDMLIFNPANEILGDIANSSKAHKITFAGQAQSQSNPVTYISNGDIYLKSTPLVKVGELKVIGRHTIENLMPAICIADFLQIPAEQIKEGLKTFTPLPHRLSKVHQTKDGVVFVDDSLATTPEATISALDSFENQPIILIAGGFDRQQNFDILAKKILEKDIKKLILFPPTGERIENAVLRASQESQARKNPPIAQVSNMSEAIVQAMSEIATPCIVLLSPASASFGLFKDYEDRAEQFLKEAQKY